MENYVHRSPRLGDRRSIIVRIGISDHHHWEENEGRHPSRTVTIIWFQSLEPRSPQPGPWGSIFQGAVGSSTVGARVYALFFRGRPLDPPHHPLRRIPADLDDQSARMIPPAPVLRLSTGFELHGLNVRPGDDEVVLDAA